MKETLLSQIEKVKYEFNSLKNQTSEKRSELKENLQKLTVGMKKYSQNWIGEWFGDNYNQYYLNFNSKSQKGMIIDEDFINEDLQKNFDIELPHIKTDLLEELHKFHSFQDYILSELSIIKTLDNYVQESTLIEQLENFEWGITSNDYINKKRPRYVFVDDPSVINRKIDNPPHIKIEGLIIHLLSQLVAIDNFEKTAARLIRQIEIKASFSDAETGPGIQISDEVLITFFDKFHTVATQLQNRYNKRDTITIKDEYDVQDVLNALLRIHFEDVRKEEYTPSYAGGSTRVDFLLKREQIVIEVKKSRASLKDKDIGDQLILDIAHYKSHPDCKKLICFVYDPENYVSNPRGIEDDLIKLSTDDMPIEVYIRP
ncbi:hypothetical protein ACE01N_19545 [Saccharicrinis sp. FJH2]|uniref:PD-(D/E)XK nuclease domain-containing protein n=1 Tax=Saccharicrinis sp. FJH65 TaxID=3344659 RepID=UPI0035F28AD7